MSGQGRPRRGRVMERKREQVARLIAEQELGPYIFCSACGGTGHSAPDPGCVACGGRFPLVLNGVVQRCDACVDSCVFCEGTGSGRRALARALLRDREQGFYVHAARKLAERMIAEGEADDPGWRELLAVRGDEMQSVGDPQGEAVALYLGAPGHPRLRALRRVHSDPLPALAREWREQWERAHRVPCPSCVARSPRGASKLSTWEWGYVTTERERDDATRQHGWKWRFSGIIRLCDYTRAWSMGRPCPDCRGRGYIVGRVVSCKACEGSGHPFMQLQVIYPDGSNGWTCRACSGRGHTLEPLRAPNPVMGHVQARLGRMLLAMLDGECPWAPSAPAQPSECPRPDCKGGRLQGRLEDTMGRAIAQALDGGPSVVTLTDNGTAEPDVGCPDCRGTGHNLRGYIPEVETSPARRFKKDGAGVFAREITAPLGAGFRGLVAAEARLAAYDVGAHEWKRLTGARYPRLISRTIARHGDGAEAGLHIFPGRLPGPLPPELRGRLIVEPTSVHRVCFEVDG